MPESRLLASPSSAWLLVATQGAEPGAPVAEILSERELSVYLGMQVPKRRNEWLLGRTAAKELVRHYLRKSAQLEVPLVALDIEAARDGAPTLRANDPRLRHLEAHSISLSHRDGVAVAALSTAGPVGVDLETVEPRSPGFVEDYFTDQEKEQIGSYRGRDRDVAVTALWSAKEAALKACRLGLTVDTRAMCCTIDGEPAPRSTALAGPDDRPAGTSAEDGAGAGWHRTVARLDAARLRAVATNALPTELGGWWRCFGRFVLTLAQAPAGTAPVTGW
jgi:4'-phosphopantetheinyl transferase